MTLEQVYARAETILAEPKHWYQGDLHNEERTAYCSLGAIQMAYVGLGHTDIPVHSGASKLFGQLLAADYPEFTAGGYYGTDADWFGYRKDDFLTSHWNDAEDRTHAEVIAAFQKA